MLLALEFKLVFGPKALFINIVLSIAVIFPHKFDYYLYFKTLSVIIT